MEEILQCQICFVAYAAQGKLEPRMLHCSHSMCKGCIDELMRNKKITCPFCRKEQKSWQQRRNLSIVQMIEILNIRLCQQCSKSFPSFGNGTALICPICQNKILSRQAEELEKICTWKAEVQEAHRVKNAAIKRQKEMEGMIQEKLNEVEKTTQRKNDFLEEQRKMKIKISACNAEVQEANRVKNAAIRRQREMEEMIDESNIKKKEANLARKIAERQTQKLEREMKACRAELEKANDAKNAAMKRLEELKGIKACSAEAPGMNDAGRGYNAETRQESTETLDSGSQAQIQQKLNKVHKTTQTKNDFPEEQRRMKTKMERELHQLQCKIRSRNIVAQQLINLENASKQAHAVLKELNSVLMVFKTKLEVMQTLEVALKQMPLGMQEEYKQKGLGFYYNTETGQFEDQQLLILEAEMECNTLERALENAAELTRKGCHLLIDETNLSLEMWSHRSNSIITIMQQHIIIGWSMQNILAAVQNGFNKIILFAARAMEHNGKEMKKQQTFAAFLILLLLCMILALFFS